MLCPHAVGRSDALQFDVGDFDFKMRSFLKRQLKQKLFKSTPKRVLLRDKIGFVLGTAHLWYVQTLLTGFIG